VTEPKKQDGTIELDVGQIDLLDLPLPPRSGSSLGEGSEEPRVSKGPPPLPPSLAPDAPPPESTSAEDAAKRAFAAEAAFNPLPPPEPPRSPVSARKLVAEAPKEKNPVAKFLLGVGGASILCVALFVGYRAMTKKNVPVPPQPAPSAATSQVASAAPTQAFTMAPIEFTATTDDSASAAPSASAPPAATTRTHASGATTPHATSTATPRRTDEVIKVEN